MLQFQQAVKGAVGMSDFCGVTVSFGDDEGNNSSTFQCMLLKDHPGLHVESGVMVDDGGSRKSYTLAWEDADDDRDSG